MLDVRISEDDIRPFAFKMNPSTLEQTNKAMENGTFDTEYGKSYEDRHNSTEKGVR